MKKSKIIAAYLPQYHETLENNSFWGKGYTDWVAVKNAKKLFKNHVQPKVPLNNYYYDLSNVDVIKWQAELALKYGVDGFNIYHYWFKDGKQALNIPAELLLNNKEINIEFMFTWDNTSWVRSWSNVSGNDWAPSYEGSQKYRQILLELDYGNESQWEKHFNYLLPYFKDKRYIKIEGKPVFGFMKSRDVSVLSRMRDCWQKLAKNNGFPGLYLISKQSIKDPFLFDNTFFYEPIHSGWRYSSAIDSKFKKVFGVSLKKLPFFKYIMSYDRYWHRLLKNAERYHLKNVFLGGLVKYDDSPRRGDNGRILIDSTPEKFESYFSKLYEISCNDNRELLFLTAWNEWGEGAYLEPDENSGLGYLEALQSAKNRVIKELSLL